MPKSVVNEQVPSGEQGQANSPFDPFAVPDVHSVPRQEGKAPYDSLVGKDLEAARSICPEAPAEDEAERLDNPPLPEPSIEKIGWQSMGAGVVKK